MRADDDLVDAVAVHVAGPKRERVAEEVARDFAVATPLQVIGGARGQDVAAERQVRRARQRAAIGIGEQRADHQVGERVPVDVADVLQDVREAVARGASVHRLIGVGRRVVARPTRAAKVDPQGARLGAVGVVLVFADQQVVYAVGVGVKAYGVVAEAVFGAVPGEHGGRDRGERVVVAEAAACDHPAYAGVAAAVVVVHRRGEDVVGAVAGHVADELGGPAELVGVALTVHEVVGGGDGAAASPARAGAEEDRDRAGFAVAVGRARCGDNDVVDAVAVKVAGGQAGADLVVDAAGDRPVGAGERLGAGPAGASVVQVGFAGVVAVSVHLWGGEQQLVEAVTVEIAGGADRAVAAEAGVRFGRRPGRDRVARRERAAEAGAFEQVHRAAATALAARADQQLGETVAVGVADQGDGFGEAAGCALAVDGDVGAGGRTGAAERGVDGDGRLTGADPAVAVVRGDRAGPGLVALGGGGGHGGVGVAGLHAVHPPRVGVGEDVAVGIGAGRAAGEVVAGAGRLGRDRHGGDVGGSVLDVHDVRGDDVLVAVVEDGFADEVGVLGDQACGQLGRQRVASRDLEPVDAPAVADGERVAFGVYDLLGLADEGVIDGTRRRVHDDRVGERWAVGHLDGGGHRLGVEDAIVGGRDDGPDLAAFDAGDALAFGGRASRALGPSIGQGDLVPVGIGGGRDRAQRLAGVRIGRVEGERVDDRRDVVGGRHVDHDVHRCGFTIGVGDGGGERVTAAAELYGGVEDPVGAYHRRSDLPVYRVGERHRQRVSGVLYVCGEAGDVHGGGVLARLHGLVQRQRGRVVADPPGVVDLVLATVATGRQGEEAERAGGGDQECGSGHETYLT